MIGQLASEADAKSNNRPSLLQGEVFNTYCTLLRRLQWPHLGNGKQAGNSEDAPSALRCLGITSSERREGVSTVAWQLAAAAADSGEQHILLVDANPRYATVHRTFRLKRSPGLTESLLNPEMLEQSIRPLDGQSLSVLPAGNYDSKVMKAFASAAIDEVIGLLRPHYGLIVFDMPPTDDNSLGLRLAELMDGVLMVVEAERACQETASRATQILNRNGVNVLGAVLNKERNQGRAR
jgi:capsular exopolysaccharide synthesis family protein